MIGMNLLVQQLRLAIAELVKQKGIEGARVLSKTNARGEIVVAVILPLSFGDVSRR